MPGNARRSNGSRRTATVAWLRAQGQPCHICGLPVDYGAPQGDPTAFECDELTPVSKGGSPYDRSNVAASHRCCNCWRSNRSVAYVRAARASVLASFGSQALASPLAFVAAAKAVERSRKLAVAPRAVAPPKTTTEW